MGWKHEKETVCKDKTIVQGMNKYWSIKANCNMWIWIQRFCLYCLQNIFKEWFQGYRPTQDYVTQEYVCMWPQG